MMNPSCSSRALFILTVGVLAPAAFTQSITPNNTAIRISFVNGPGDWNVNCNATTYRDFELPTISINPDLIPRSRYCINLYEAFTTMNWTETISNDHISNTTSDFLIEYNSTINEPNVYFGVSSPQKFMNITGNDTAYWLWQNISTDMRKLTAYESEDCDINTSLPRQNQSTSNTVTQGLNSIFSACAYDQNTFSESQCGKMPWNVRSLAIEADVMVPGYNVCASRQTSNDANGGLARSSMLGAAAIGIVGVVLVL